MKRLLSFLLALGLLPICGAAWGQGRCGASDPGESIAACTDAILRHRARRDILPDLLAADYENRAIAYEKKNMLAEALADYDQAVALKPGFVTFYNRGNFHAQYGEAPVALDDLGRAIILYERATLQEQRIFTEDAYAAAFSQRADTFQRIGRDAEAVADYAKAIALQPRNDTLPFNRALSYSRMAQYDNAIADLTQVIAMRQQRDTAMGALLNRGLAHMHKGDFVRAIADMDEAIRRSGNSPTAYARRGFVWERAGERSKAITDYRQALQLYASLPEAQDGLKRLGAE